jgi:KAT8 regulatory NSL complex subunit 1
LCDYLPQFSFSLFSQSEEEEVEDVSEEACTARHERSEQEERRKFMTYLKQPAGLTRGRRRVDHMAADSRTEHSSGANTPDPVPMSPGPDNSSTPLASAAVGPAAIPVKVPVAVDVSSSVMEVDDDAADTSSTATEHFPALAIKERRRTASLTKKDAVWKFIQDDNSGMSWDLEEVKELIILFIIIIIIIIIIF